jgi:predicted cytidylate kinase
MIITISGLPGSGKTTIAKMLSERLGLAWYSMGDLRGKMAADMGITIDELNTRALTDPTSDHKVDEYQKTLGEKNDNFISDGLMAAHFIPRAKKIFLTVDQNIAAERIFNDRRGPARSDEPAYASIAEVRETLTRRVQNNRERYLKLYGYDYLDPKNYDAVMNTTHSSPEEVFAKIQEVIGSH